VVVSFGENVFRAVRAVKRDDRRFDAFESPAYPALGMINEDVTLYEHLIRQPERLVPGVRMPLDLKPDFESGILVLPQIPGVLPTYYRAALHQAGDAAGQAPRGIVIQSLGAGNIPTEGDQSLVPFIYEACEMGIPVLLASQYPIYPANLGKYRPPRRAIAAGAIPVVNMTTAALIAKLSWVIARVGDSSGDRLTELVRAYMLNNLVGEIDDQDLAVLGQLDVANIRLSVAEEADAGSPDPLGHGITD
jgi:L-asparaginase/Glu-tRNA(Gln) amidotransferase subunit D